MHAGTSPEVQAPLSVPRRKLHESKMKFSFNPSHYFAANPDASKAVQDGVVASAWDHFVRVGCREDRPGVPDPIRRVVKAVLNASLVSPPTSVLSKVQGMPDAAAYEMEGKILALDLFSAIVPFFEMHRSLRILNFGCGYGQVSRFLREAFPSSLIRATDADEGAIAWCKGAYQDEVRKGYCTFDVTPRHPPLPFTTDYFDVVCAVAGLSLFSERLELEWLSELRRITKPAGCLVFSKQGEALSKYFAILKTFPSGIPGERELALCMKHAHTVI
jgi:SAM-dependent methyltransferase